jgi:rare lipoprotein A
VKREVTAACLVLLAGCGTYGGTRAPDVAPARPAPAVQPATPPAATPSPPGAQFPRSGGYYLDDGPGANPPPNLQAVPDAVPRAEPLHRGALRPYSVMGRNYVPMTALEPYRARGVASWYGRRYHGKLTSTGEPYDMYG